MLPWGGDKTLSFNVTIETPIQKLYRYMNKITMEELVNIVLTHSSKMTSMNEPASTPPRLLIIDRLALTST
uniref:Uncharacterized protein n=1 Tax=Nelumbo nucifera TaxID=4432 RepID=A0A822Y7J7_NELNU|nr:TPA_asm: hypothetical protein HUJ06_027042 [Nelumbo nucifera]DAD25667.1 TPA_asm: hypothetical protein HUJ06_027131 [Nelumbo nucifera]DAD25692.1 TPA_asm: hypothetical protein HUJ06_027156 [Nelumbo nucifera]